VVPVASERQSRHAFERFIAFGYSPESDLPPEQIVPSGGKWEASRCDTSLAGTFPVRCFSSPPEEESPRYSHSEEELRAAAVQPLELLRVPNPHIGFFEHPHMAELMQVLNPRLRR